MGPRGIEAAMASPIRRATPADADRAVGFMGEFYAEAGYAWDPPRARDAIDRLIRDETLGRLWLILHDGEPIGYVAITFGYSLEHLGRDAFIDELYIRPPFRGRGLGTRTLEAVEPACAALGVRTLHLEVERSNPAGQTLYRRRGFRGNDRRLLSKRLEAPRNRRASTARPLGPVRRC